MKFSLCSSRSLVCICMSLGEARPSGDAQRHDVADVASYVRLVMIYKNVTQIILNREILLGIM